MNPTGKKLLSLFLVFSLMMLSVNLYAKERQGATLIIQRKSDQVKNTRLEGTPWETSYRTGIKGELIAVKQNSLLLLDTEGKDVSVDIEEIKVIRVVKKLGVEWGALAGLLGGALAGAFYVGMFALILRASWGEASSLMAKGGGIGAPIGAIIGGIVGARAGMDKEIQIEGKSDIEIQKTMDKLRKKARIRDYK